MPDVESDVSPPLRIARESLLRTLRFPKQRRMSDYGTGWCCHMLFWSTEGRRYHWKISVGRCFFPDGGHIGSITMHDGTDTGEVRLGWKTLWNNGVADPPCVRGEDFVFPCMGDLCLHPYQVVQGDVCDATEDLILQQNNCVAVRPHGLSEHIALRFPYANPYGVRKGLGRRNLAIQQDQPEPGNIRIFKPLHPTHGPTFVSMFAQYGMGRPGAYTLDGYWESFEDRRDWFRTCLNKVATLRPASVAMPWNIGCGLAGGDWKEYEQIIDVWARIHPEIRVVLYAFEG